RPVSARRTVIVVSPRLMDIACFLPVVVDGGTSVTLARAFHGFGELDEYLNTLPETSGKSRNESGEAAAATGRCERRQSKLTISTQLAPLPAGYFWSSRRAPLPWSIA